MSLTPCWTSSRSNRRCSTSAGASSSAPEPSAAGAARSRPEEPLVRFLELPNGTLNAPGPRRERLRLPFGPPGCEEVAPVDMDRARQLADRVGDRVDDVGGQGDDIPA